jgi:hypothetical protein
MALGGVGTDQVTLYVGRASEDGNHQALFACEGREYHVFSLGFSLALFQG